MTSPTVAPRTAAGSAAPDAVAAAAVDLAREAAEEVAAPGTVGEYLGVVVEGTRLVTHRFASTAAGYRGWTWSVVVARAPRARTATVCEAVLLPADDAILAPPWLPWSERVAPGDLGVQDVLGYRADDPFLEQGYEATGEDADELAIWELGLGRKRVLSALGRADAAKRWYEGSHGPTADVAVHAAAACSTCGYFLALAGELRTVFGVCANEWSPSEGRVVSLDHGCGAHSETDVEPNPPEVPGYVLDDGEVEALDLREAEPVPVVEPEPEPVAGPEPVAEAVVEAAAEESDTVLAGPGEAPAEDVLAAASVEPSEGAVESEVAESEAESTTGAAGFPVAEVVEVEAVTTEEAAEDVAAEAVQAAEGFPPES